MKRRVLSRRREQLTRTARRALLIGIGVFITLQLALVLDIEFLDPALRDPTYGDRLRTLKQRIAENSERPLVLFLGSSRTEAGVNAELLNTCPQSESPLVFNFGMPRHGFPVYLMLDVDRLFRDGIRPQHLYVEILTPTLANGSPAESYFPPEQLDHADLFYMRPFFERPRRMVRRWMQSRLTAMHQQRLMVMHRCANSWLPPETRAQISMNRTKFGYSAFGAPRDAAERQKRVEHTRWEYRGCFREFAVQRGPDAAVREIARRCQAEGVPVTFVLMPETSMMRSWYPAQAHEAIHTFVANIQRDCQVEVIDMRDWVQDDSLFADGHHLLSAGAEALTGRILSDVLSRSDSPAGDRLARERAAK